MTRREVEELINKLSESFNKKVRFRWSTKARRGLYYRGINQIVVGPRSPDILASVVHEFAHALTPEERAKKGIGKKRIHHEKFFFNLVSVIREVYGDVRSYPWWTEYRNIRKRARKEGWV